MKRTFLLILLIFVFLLTACGKQGADSSAEATSEADGSSSPVITKMPSDSPSSSYEPTDIPSEKPNSDDTIITYEEWRDSEDRIGMRILISEECRNNKLIISCYDSQDNPVVHKEKSPLQEAIIDWDENWQPSGYSFEECSAYLLPQLWEDPLALQDLCALYLLEMGTYKEYVPEMTLESLIEYLKKTDRPQTEVFQKNLAAIEELAAAQQGRFAPIEGSVETDLDGDGGKETIEVRVTSDVKTNAYGNSLNEYSLYVNETLVQTFYYSEMTTYLLDLDTCKVIYISPSPYYTYCDDDYRTEPGRARRAICDAMFRYTDGKVDFIGAIDGHYTMYIGEGRFLTTGKYSYVPADYVTTLFAVYSYVREYGVMGDGRMYCLSNNFYDFFNYTGNIVDWQQSNTVWTLKNDLPLYEEDGITISDRVLKAGSNVIVRGVSANGFLYVCDEEGHGGVIRMIWPQELEEDPYAAPGGRRMTYYFLHYDSYTGADSE